MLSVGAFVIALLEDAGVVAPSRLTEAIVLGALIGCVVLVGAHAWSRTGTSSTSRPG